MSIDSCCFSIAINLRFDELISAVYYDNTSSCLLLSVILWAVIAQHIEASRRALKTQDEYYSWYHVSDDKRCHFVCFQNACDVSYNSLYIV